MQESLDQLPNKYRPNFSLLRGELSNASADLHNAGLSQPLYTALQIVLVRLLRTLGVFITTVVGHSSGEIATAYAAGYLTATDAIRIAYLRGVVASQAKRKNGQLEAMIAVGMSAKEAIDLCSQDDFKKRVTMAANNAPSSVTLSGDADGIHQLEQRLREEKKFGRLLRVDIAYHSHHMDACSAAYQQALKECHIQVQSPTGP